VVDHLEARLAPRKVHPGDVEQAGELARSVLAQEAQHLANALRLGDHRQVAEGHAPACDRAREARSDVLAQFVQGLIH
jgi:hypothetical protein